MQTDRIRKKIRACVSLTAVLAVALCMTALPAMAAEDSSTGSFEMGNAAPTVAIPILYADLDEDGTFDDVVSAMDPTTEYAVAIAVSDTNTLNDLAEIEVIIRITGTTGDDVVDKKATYKWTSGATPVWTKEGPTGRWSLVESASTWHTPLTDTTGTWILHFKPGPVAKEVSNWEIYAKATDKATTPGVGENTLTPLSMNWYGEITATDTGFDFGSISLGDTDKPITGDTDVDVNAIANGAYKLETKSGDWTKGTDTANLDYDGTLTDPLSIGHFALENDGAGDVGSSNYVMDTYTTVTDFVSKTAPTAEAGNDEAIYVWVSVAPTGFMPGIYSGTYNVQILTD